MKKYDDVKEMWCHRETMEEGMYYCNFIISDEAYYGGAYKEILLKDITSKQISLKHPHYRVSFTTRTSCHDENIDENNRRLVCEPSPKILEDYLKEFGEE